MSDHEGSWTIHDFAAGRTVSGVEASESVTLRSKTTLSIIVRARRKPSAVARAKKAGAKAWLIKPVRMDLFVDVVKKLAN